MPIFIDRGAPLLNNAANANSRRFPDLMRGVTAGLDFALALVAELRDRKYAEGVQLLAQYAPAPPFNAGEPGTAPEAVATMIDNMFAGLKEEMRAAAAAAYARSKGL